MVEGTCWELYQVTGFGISDWMFGFCNSTVNCQLDTEWWWMMSWKGLSRKQPLPTWQYCPSIYLTWGHYFYFISQLSAVTSCWFVYHINITVQLITHTGSRTTDVSDKQQLSDEVRILCDLVSVSHCMVGMPTMLQGYVLCVVCALGKETHFIIGTVFTVRTGWGWRNSSTVNIQYNSAVRWQHCDMWN